MSPGVRIDVQPLLLGIEQTDVVLQYNILLVVVMENNGESAIAHYHLLCLSTCIFAASLSCVSSAARACLQLPLPPMAQ